MSREFTPTPQQEAIFEDIRSGTGHTLVSARAGTGKTSTIIAGLHELSRDVRDDTLLCAFNKSIETELSRRAPSGVTVNTLHSLGLRAIGRALGKKPTVDKEKMYGIARGLSQDRVVRGLIVKGASFAKNELRTTYDEIDAMLDERQLVPPPSPKPEAKLTDPMEDPLLPVEEAEEVEGAEEEVEQEVVDELEVEARDKLVKLILLALEKAREDQSTVDFDDMIWFPSIFEIPMLTYQRVFVDEVQDLNPAQLKLVLKFVSKGGRICGVGDPFQSIYGWRGADSQAIPKFIKRTKAKELPLTVSFRCATKIVEKARRIVPDFQASALAPEGYVGSVAYDEFVEQASPGDFVLSRSNAPLVSGCLSFIRAGRQATILGKELGERLLGVIERSEATSVDDFLVYVQKWHDREAERLRKVDRETTEVDDLAGCLVALTEDADNMAQVKSRVTRLALPVDPEHAVTFATTHKCVSPTTIVETSHGLRPIADIEKEGVIGTADGAAGYCQKVTYDKRDMLRLTTKSGYEVEVTADHGMMAWVSGGLGYVRREAQDLRKGDFLRLRLGAVIDVVDTALPPAPGADVRAKLYNFPAYVDADVAEFFGLVVADGTVFRGGVRLKKCYADVTQRFADLANRIFGTDVTVTPGTNTYDAEIHSTQIAAWLLSIGGMAPNAKAVPDCILQSSLKAQAAFLRGLFEDGTVNVRWGRLDHVSWSTRYPRMAQLVQLLLLRHGIIAARKPRFGQWRVEVYGYQAHLFRDRVGFVSKYKNDLLETPTGDEEGYTLPVARADLARAPKPTPGSRAAIARQNALHRGYLSRAGAKALGGFEEELGFHHDRIVKVEKFQGPAMCVTVPSVGRFLQNGFDGCNSKGLERHRVWVFDWTYAWTWKEDGVTQEDRNLYYVAVTRAKEELYLVGRPNRPKKSQ